MTSNASVLKSVGFHLCEFDFAPHRDFSAPRHGASPMPFIRLQGETNVALPPARSGSVATSRLTHGQSCRIKFSRRMRALTAGGVDAGRFSDAVAKQASLQCCLWEHSDARDETG